MKKLMTMLSAAAMAFGLFAEPVVNGTSFEGEGYPEGAITAATLNTADTAATWTVADGKVTVTAYGAETPYTGGRPNQFENADQDKYLAVKTALGTEFATRAAAVTAGDDGLYADMLVKFTAAEDAPAIPSGTKVAVWLKETEGENDAPSTYNLMVSAGYLADGVVVVTNYNCGNYEGNLDAWHRVTIKSIANIYESGDARDGFAIWVDKDIVGTEDAMSDDGDDWKANLNENAGEFAKEGNLFISADANVTGISEVAFSGTGSVDDISVTQVLPFDDAADKQADKFTVNNVPVKSIEEAFEAAADVEGEAVIAPVAAYAGNLVITTPIEIDEVAGGNSIVLDLAGKMITFVGETSDYAISVLNDAVSLTITNSTPALGCIDSNCGAVYLGDCLGTVKIQAGGIKGGIANEMDGTFEITGGKFTADPTDLCANGFEPVELTEDPDGYNYEVRAIVYHTATFMVEGEQYASQQVKDGEQATAPSPDPTKDGHTFTGWSPAFAPLTADQTYTAQFTAIKYDITFVNGETSEPIAVKKVDYGTMPEAPETPVVTGKSFEKWDPTIVAVTDAATYTALYTANVYTVTFESKGGSAVDPQTVEYNTTAMEPTPAPTKENYEFKGWFKDDETFAQAWDFKTDVVTADTTLYAKWESAAPVTPGEEVAKDLDGEPAEKAAAAEVINAMCVKTSATAADVKAWLGTFATMPKAAEIAAARSLDVSYQLGAQSLFTQDPVAEVVTFAQAADAAEGKVGYDLTFNVKNGAEGDAVTVAAKAAAYVETLVQANEKVDFGSDTALEADITATPNGTAAVQVKVELPADKAAAFMKVATPAE